MTLAGITLPALLVVQALGQGQQINLVQTFKDGGFMMWPLGLMAVLGVIVIVWKFIDLQIKGQRTRALLGETDQLLAEHRIDEAIRRCEESQAPAAAILLAGLNRRKEGTDRVMKAIENAGLFELAGLERGLVWLATLANVAPLTGFLGTVIGMIQAFQAIELAGEVEATTVAGGIKVALITTASGLTIAIPINIAHNYFVTKIDRLVIEMEESAQRMIDALHAIEAKTTTV
jgi:biopolymer transport protein ExbB